MVKKLLHPKAVFFFTLTVAVSLFCWATFRISYVPMPRSGEGALIYVNHAGDDLRMTVTKAIDQAKKSVTLIIYTLTDPQIINTLNEKARNGVAVTVIYDKKGSRKIFHKLDSKVHAVPVRGKGLMHQKLLVIDEEQVWIGSANMTSQSLRMHENLMIGMHSPTIAKTILNKANSHMRVGLKQAINPSHVSIGNQESELLFLPDDPLAVEKITNMIESAKKSIRIAMFTWTRPDFAQAAAKAKERGVTVEVVVDSNSGNGVGAKVVSYLRRHGIPVHLSEGASLLHHKLMLIDDETLVTGSANWTKAAFTQNDDCIIILKNLTSAQKQKLDTMWLSMK